MVTNTDKDYMQLALNLAKKGIYTTSPNPNVGCVIVKNNQIIGRGYHYKAGEAHAEVYALKEAGLNALGADLYVTLEPCSHYGRTAPCVDEVIGAGIRRVIIGMQDPYHEVAGLGISKLRAAGIEVEVGFCESQATELNLGFISRIKRNKPWVTLKIAASIDGKTALLNGNSKWITSEDSRIDVHYLRARSDVIITGSGTVLHDNPRLNVRDIDVVKSPTRLVIDSKLVTSPDSLIYTPDADVILVTGAHFNNDKLNQFKDKNVKIWDEFISNNQIDLSMVINKLSKDQVNYVIVEAGNHLNGQFIKNDLVDEIIVYFAPSILGDSALSMFNLPQLDDLRDKFQFYFHDVQKLGSDLKITLRKYQ